MATFERAYLATMGHEAGDGVGWVNHPNDPGKETVYGIARAKHPKWPGWVLVDAAKDATGRPQGLPTILAHAPLTDLVREFFEARFWEPIWGDAIPDEAQCIAEELFDTGVNTGVGTGVRFLQQALNAFNRSYRTTPLWDELVVDSAFGAKTFDTLIRYLDSGESVARLYKAQNIMQGAFYFTLTRQSARYEAFIRGWLERVELREKGAT